MVASPSAKWVSSRANQVPEGRVCTGGLRSLDNDLPDCRYSQSSQDLVRKTQSNGKYIRLSCRFHRRHDCTKLCPIRTYLMLRGRRWGRSESSAKGSSPYLLTASSSRDGYTTRPPPRSLVWSFWRYSNTRKTRKLPSYCWNSAAPLCKGVSECYPAWWNATPQAIYK